MSTLIQRKILLEKINVAFKTHRIVAILGPRQCGKTTLAREYWKLNNKMLTDLAYFDLENPVHLARLETPDLTLKNLTGLILIDEIQRRPDLFPYLRYLHDEQLEQQFLILVSTSRALIQQSSESLAGRIAYIEITPFLLNEVGDLRKLWLLGGFPNSYLATPDNSMFWRKQYINSYIENDLSSYGFAFNYDILRRFWYMLTHYHGQIFNAAELATALSVSPPTIRRYLSLLEATFMIRVINPWFENIKKRQVKNPKIYFKDSGILHYFLDIATDQQLIMHPKVGASWEGFALEQICQYLSKDSNDVYFWATHNQAEIDLVTKINGEKVGFEFKYQDAPKLTPSMKIAMEDLNLQRIEVLYPGTQDYKLTNNISVKSLGNLLSTIH